MLLCLCYCFLWVSVWASVGNIIITSSMWILATRSLSTRHVGATRCTDQGCQECRRPHPLPSMDRPPALRGVVGGDAQRRLCEISVLHIQLVWVDEGLVAAFSGGPQPCVCFRSGGHCRRRSSGAALGQVGSGSGQRVATLRTASLTRPRSSANSALNSSTLHTVRAWRLPSSGGCCAT